MTAREQTNFGMNAWVLGHDTSLYGDDADIFRPIRWLEYSDVERTSLGTKFHSLSVEELIIMESYNMAFGTGARSCPGKRMLLSLAFLTEPDM